MNKRRPELGQSQTNHLTGDQLSIQVKRQRPEDCQRQPRNLQPRPHPEEEEVDDERKHSFEDLDNKQQAGPYRQPGVRTSQDLDDVINDHSPNKSTKTVKIKSMDTEGCS